MSAWMCQSPVLRSYTGRMHSPMSDRPVATAFAALVGVGKFSTLICVLRDLSLYGWAFGRFGRRGFEQVPQTCPSGQEQLAPRYFAGRGFAALAVGEYAGPFRRA